MPSNTAAELATTITSLPYSITVAPDNSSQVLWWKYTAPVGQVAVGLFAWADDAGAYRPKLSVWRGDSPYTIDTDTPLAGSEAARKPCVLPLSDGDTYYFKVRDTNATEPLGAPLVFSVLPAPVAKARRGDFFIPDETGGATDNENWFPASLTSPTTQAVTRLTRFASGERGDVLPTGEILSANWNSIDGHHLSLYRKDFVKITDIPGRQGESIRGQGTLGVFYVYDSLANEIITVSRTGAVGGTIWTLTTPRSIAANAAGTILYYTSSSLAGSALKRWDLVNDAALTDVTGSAVVNYGIGEDVLVMDDDTVVVFYGKASPADYFARRYSADGSTILNTYSFGSQAPGRINIGVDRSSFTTYAHLADTQSQFTTYDLAGTVLDQFESYQCNSGFFQFATPIADPQRFGHSQSCPFLVLQQDEQTILVDESIPCCESSCDCPPPTWPAPGVPPTQGGSPSSQPLPTQTGAILPPVSMTSWTPLCAGGGDVPSASDATDAESWVS